MPHYTKTYSELSDLVALLKRRGMTIDNETKAEIHWSDKNYCCGWGMKVFIK